MQGPEIYLNELGVTLNCCVNQSQPAVLDSTLRVMIGYESFFFASMENRDTFLKDLDRYCGRLTDPVNKVRFRPTDNSPSSVYNDRTYYFASAANKSMFDAMPDMYYLPDYRMLPVDSITGKVIMPAPN